MKPTTALQATTGLAASDNLPVMDIGMHGIRALLFAIFVLASGVSWAEEQLTQEKRADIEQLLEVTGAMAVSQQMAGAASGQLAETIGKLRPDIPAEIVEVLPEEVEAVFEENMDTFKSAVVVLYHTHFTAPEIKEMICFYGTDLGRKMIKVTPALMRDSMEIGRRWGQSLGPQIDARIRARLQKEGVAI